MKSMIVMVMLTDFFSYSILLINVLRENKTIEYWIRIESMVRMKIR